LTKKPVPVLASKPKAAVSPAAGAEKPPKLWTFGFSYFKQIKYFGFDNIGPSWFASLFEKLRELSGETVDEFLADGLKKHTWRYHEIDWSAYRIPISLKSLDWLPADVVNNQAEFPIQQFQVSMALGRVVGYFDAEQVFQIVLLDPLHNIQPSKDFNYRVTRSLPVNCQYTQLREDVIKAAIQATCTDGACPVKGALSAINTKPTVDKNVVIMTIDDDSVKVANEHIANEKAASYADIFANGLLTLLD
jgi:hypothetical protein